MHFKSLNDFCDVVEPRSLSRAADENGISQSGASQMVHQLEERLGVQLIDRSKRPFVLTPEGQTFFDGCRTIVERYFELEEDVRTLHDEAAGRVVVASIYSVGLYHMNRCLKDFRSRYPRSDVQIEYHHPDRVCEMVDGDQADLGLVSYPKGSRTIEVIPWLEEPMVLVCAPGHHLADRGSIELADLNGCDVVAFVSELRIRREIDRQLAAAGADLRVAMELDNIETVKRAIEIDAGVGLLPAPTVEREVAAGTLVGVPIGGCPLIRPVGIIVRRRKPLGRTASRLIELLQQLAGQLVAGGERPPQPLTGLEGVNR